MKKIIRWSDISCVEKDYVSDIEGICDRAVEADREHIERAFKYLMER